MKPSKIGEAGAAENGDILVTVTPADAPGIEIEVSGKAVILKQFGRQIRELINKTAAECGVENAHISAKDSGALDFTIKARVRAAIRRAV